MRRTWVAGLGCALAAGVLTACGPAVQGVGGVRLDADEGLVAVLAWCRGFGDPTTVILYAVELDGSVGDPVVNLKRVGAPPTGRYVEIPLSDPPPEWRVDRGQLTMDDPARAYELRAWNGDGDNRVSSFPFRISELRDRPEPAKPVLTKTLVGNSNGVDQYDVAFRTPEEFRAAAEGRCGNG